MRYRFKRLEITEKCFKHHGNEGAVVLEALEITRRALIGAIANYPDKKYIIEVYVEDKDSS